VAPDIAHDAAGGTVEVTSADLSRIFHKLNNQLGVILANAELLESRLTDEPQRARAGQVVTGALEAISAIQDLRRIVGLSGPIVR
jgi:signal transduction histidine kinase